VSKGKGDKGISQQTEDAIVNAVCSRLVNKRDPGSGKSMFQILREETPAADMAVIDASLERHAARQRAAGKPGW